ncbi:putative sybindin-like family domain-containing protein [Neospora caninum Liverpool]|uniref:Peroxin-12 n=1 Tax=Neospora caninum (strain Liverpool) TaxID=572307 RepID=F0VQU1_NEOCL|nr:putative sybindin-like family domain-containing protein [Neospora caninum Liverpool]CBZ56088.1 putative sybindin-like family domain-containing protein [Neospora caninum Liverpool]|eukprot:XP_003886114.1 putative sybindin-like family domain-containing protein [Neospora caninum Liverpool]
MIFSFYIFHRHQCIYSVLLSSREEAPDGASASDTSSVSTPGAGATLFLPTAPGSAATPGYPGSRLGASADGVFPASSAGSSQAGAASAAASSAFPNKGQEDRRSAAPGKGGGREGASGHTRQQLHLEKLLSGLLFSMKKFCEQIGPQPQQPGAPHGGSVATGGAGSVASQLQQRRPSTTIGGPFHAFTTPTYKLHCLETPTGYKFVCLTSPDVPTLRDSLNHIYVALFVEFVVKAPGYRPSLPVTQPIFVDQLVAFLKSLPYFAPATAQRIPPAAGPQKLAGRLSAQLLLLLLSRSSLQQPSFFEVLAQQKLLESLLSALQHFADVFRDQLERDEAPLRREAEARTQRHARDREDEGARRGTRRGEREERREAKRDRERGGRRPGRVPSSLSSGDSDGGRWLGRVIGSGGKRLLRNVVSFLKRACDEITSRRAVLWCLKHWEILFGLSMAGIEWQSLVTSSASFAERFYGLQRLDKAFLPLASSPFSSSSLASGSEASRDGSGPLSHALAQGKSKETRAQLSRLLPAEELRKNEQEAEIRSLLKGLERGGRTPAGGLGLRGRQIFFSVIFLLLPLLRRGLHAAYLRSVRTLDGPSSATVYDFFSELSPQEAERRAENQSRQEDERKGTRDTREGGSPSPAVPASSAPSFSSCGVCVRVRILRDRLVSVLSRTLSTLGQIRLSKLRRGLFVQRLWRLRRRLFVALYSPAVGLYGLVCFVYMLLYLADNAKFPYWSPYMHMLGLVYVRSPPPSSPFSPVFPLAQSSASLQGCAEASEAVARQSLRRRRFLVDCCVQSLTRLSKLSLTVLVLALRLLEWWRDYEAAAAAATQAEFAFPGLGAAASRREGYSAKKEPDEVSPPPSPLSDDETGASVHRVLLPQDDRICPLCHTPRTNAACLPTGYVFCYRCLVNFVRMHNRCPVSGRRVSEFHIRRLYEV